MLSTLIFLTSISHGTRFALANGGEPPTIICVREAFIYLKDRLAEMNYPVDYNGVSDMTATKSGLAAEITVNASDLFSSDFFNKLTELGSMRVGWGLRMR